MLNQSFTFKNFKRLRKLGDLSKYFSHDNTREMIKKLQKVEDECQQFKAFHFLPLETFSCRHKIVYKYGKNAYISDFILRKVNHNLKRIYNVTPANRNEIIRQIIQLLKEKYPCYIYKLDIKEFYESINVASLLDKIEKSRIVSALTKFFLKNFFASNSFIGLPRGINISSTLSEIYLTDFDTEIKQTDGVFYYARFVDDIIIFSVEKLNIKEIEERLPNLEFNKKKIQELQVNTSPKIEFEYLGYKIHKKDDTLSVDIAEKKIKKIKNKIFLAFYDYHHNGKFNLLKKRLLYLTASFPLRHKQQRVFNIINVGTLHGGILHSYPLIDEKSEALKQLDEFKMKMIFKGNFTNNMRSINKRELARISFVQSFQRKIKRKFSHKDIANITRCWKND